MSSIQEQLELPQQAPSTAEATSVLAQLMVREVAQRPSPGDGELLMLIAPALDLDINHFFHKLVPLAKCVTGQFAEEIAEIPMLEARCSQVMAKIRMRRARHSSFSADREQYERDEAFVRQQRREHNKIVTKLTRARDMIEHLKRVRERYTWVAEFEARWAQHQEAERPKKRAKKATSSKA